jgi:hypothetical protein
LEKALEDVPELMLEFLFVFVSLFVFLFVFLVSFHLVALHGFSNKRTTRDLNETKKDEEEQHLDWWSERNSHHKINHRPPIIRMEFLFFLELIIFHHFHPSSKGFPSGTKRNVVSKR